MRRAIVELQGLHPGPRPLYDSYMSLGLEVVKARAIAADLLADAADPPAEAAAGRAERGRGRQPPLPLPRPRPRWCATPPCTALDKTGGLKLSLYKSFNIIISRPALNQVHL